MKVLIQVSDFSMASDVREQIELGISTTLHRFQPWIESVEVHLRDQNGPKGGRDMLCTLLVKGERFPNIVINDLEVDPLVAVKRALDRAKRTLTRRVKRAAIS